MIWWQREKVLLLLLFILRWLHLASALNLRVGPTPRAAAGAVGCSCRGYVNYVAIICFLKKNIARTASRYS